MRSLITLAVLLHTVASINGQALPKPDDTQPGCYSPEACGESAVKVSAVLEPRYINDVTTDVYACECLNGDKIVVTAAGKLLLDLDNVPVGAPSSTTPAPTPTVPTPAPTPVTRPPRPDGFNADKYVANITTLNSNCTNIDVELLWEKANPKFCERPITIGEVCPQYCLQTMRAIGYDCWRALYVKGAWHPADRGSTPEIAFEQCTANVTWTLKSQYVPIPSPPPPSGPAPATANAPIAAAGKPSPSPSPTETAGGSSTDAQAPSSAGFAASKAVPLICAILGYIML